MTRHRAPASGVKLNDDDAAIVKGMLIRGDRQHDIAAWFGVNAGRIAEIATGKTFSSTPPIEVEKLLPQGPYPSGREAIALIANLELAKKAIINVESKLKQNAH